MTKIQNQAAVLPLTAESAKTSSYPGYFVQVPIELLRSDLSSAALRLYLLLLSYCGPKSWAWPSQNRLAEDMQLSERRVRSLMLELEENGLVLVKHTFGSSNTYQVRKYELKGGVLPEWSNQPSPTTDSGITKEENFRGEGKYSSAKLHEAESYHVCEKNYLEKKEQQTKVKQIRTGVRGSPIDTPPQTITVDNLVKHKGFSEEQQELETLFMTGGMSGLASKELAAIVIKNQRDSNYVKLIIEASQQPHIHNPAGFIRFMVLRNAEPTPVKQPGRVKKPDKNCSKTGTPLDFSKYITGKYAYLTTSEVQNSLIIQEEAEIADLKEVSLPDSLVPLRVEKVDKIDLRTELNPPLPDQPSFEITNGSLQLIPWIRPEHLKLRQTITNVFALEEGKTLAEWEKVLEGLENCPQASYFYPALGWLAADVGLKCYQVVFRNKFDQRAGERWLTLLVKRLKVLYGSEIRVVCYNLELSQLGG